MKSSIYLGPSLDKVMHQSLSTDAAQAGANQRRIALLQENLYQYFLTKIYTFKSIENVKYHTSKKDYSFNLVDNKLKTTCVSKTGKCQIDSDITIIGVGKGYDTKEVIKLQVMITASTDTRPKRIQHSHDAASIISHIVLLMKFCHFCGCFLAVVVFFGYGIFGCHQHMNLISIN